jgi:CubicO group peptidase (beta-lactamase class C family)
MAERERSAWEALVEFAGQKQAESRVPGVAVGILNKGEVATQGFGVTNVEHPLPITDTTLFQIGSITKTFTGTLVMRLVEQGKLELDAPVQRYLPDFRVVDAGVSAQVTVRQLMTHTGGWEGDLFLDTGPSDDAIVKYVAAMAEQTQLAPLGTHWSYNNAGFGVLGRLIELLNGQSYETVLQSQLLEPLGMEHAFLEPTDVMTHRFVVGHSVTPDGIEVLRPWQLTRATRPIGGLVTDVRDLLRYAQFHMGDSSVASQPIINAASIEAMRTRQVTVWGEEGWGLTWGVENVNGVQLVYHTGGTNGHITRLTLVPAHNFALAVFTNARQGGAVGKAIASHALDLYLGVKRPEVKAQESSTDELAQYVGLYRNAFSEVELGLLGGRLVGQFINKGGFPTRETPPLPPPPPVTFAVAAANRLMMLDGGFKNEMADVVRTPDSAIGWLRIGGRLYRRGS